MSIATQIKRLRDVKQELKEVVNEDFHKINDETIDKYPKLINDTFDEYKSYIPYKHYKGETLLINNDDNKEFRSFTFEGNQKQETTSGKNLLNNISSSQTINGITFTINQDKTVIVNGTANANAILVLNSFNFENGESYFLSGCPNGGSNSTYRLDAFGTPGLSEDTGRGCLINVAGERNIRIVIFNGTNANNLVFKPMIRLSNISDDSYEPYTNGVASPNPDYPQDIEALEGWNLFDNRFRQGSKGSITIIERLYSVQDLILEQNKTYTISTNLDTSQYRYSVNICNVPYPNIEPTINDYGWKTTSSFQFIPSVTGYAGIPISKIDNSELSLDDINGVWFQISEGAQQKQYIPYGCVGIKRSGDNLFNIKNNWKGSKTYVSSGLTYILDGDTITINGTSTGYSGAYGRAFNETEPFLRLKNGDKYRFMVEVENKAGNDEMRVYFGPTSSNPFYVGNIKGNGVFYKDFTMNEDVDLTQFSIIGGIASGATLNNTKVRMAILNVTNNNINTYKPYHEEITYIDLKGNKVLSDDEIIVDKKGNVKLIKRWDSIVLDGSENWNRAMSPNNLIARFGLSNVVAYKKGNSTGEIPNFKSNYFKSVNFNTVYDGRGGGVSWWWNTSISQIILCFNDNRSLDDFKTWLNAKKPIVYYELAEPQIIDLGEIDLSLLEDTNNIELLATLKTNLDAITISGDSYNKWKERA